MRNPLIYLAAITFFSCNGNKTEEKKSEQATHEFSLQEIDSINKVVEHASTKKDFKTEVKTYKDSLGWGYDIYINGSRSISQPTIPAVSGNQGFANEKDAKKVGELMAHKIENKIMPPSIDIKELDSLKIKYRK